MDAAGEGVDVHVGENIVRAAGGTFAGLEGHMELGAAEVVGGEDLDIEDQGAEVLDAFFALADLFDEDLFGGEEVSNLFVEVGGVFGKGDAESGAIDNGLELGGALVDLLEMMEYDAGGRGVVEGFGDLVEGAVFIEPEVHKFVFAGEAEGQGGGEGDLGARVEALAVGERKVGAAHGALEGGVEIEVSGEAHGFGLGENCSNAHSQFGVWFEGVFDLMISW